MYGQLTVEGARVLGAAAESVTEDGARVWRFTPAGVRAAFARGWTEESLPAALDELTQRKVPWALRALLGERGRGRVRGWDGPLLVAWCHQREAERKFAEENDELHKASWTAQFVSGLIMPIMMFVGNLNYVAIAVVGGVLVATGGMTLGDVQAFIQYSRQFTQPLTQVAGMDENLATLAVRREVTSPGGITARGLEALEQQLRIDVLLEQRQRGVELARRVRRQAPAGAGDAEHGFEGVEIGRDNGQVAGDTGDEPLDHRRDLEAAVHDDAGERREGLCLVRHHQCQQHLRAVAGDDHDAYTRLNFGFHQGLAWASHNPMLAQQVNYRELGKWLTMKM